MAQSMSVRASRCRDHLCQNDGRQLMTSTTFRSLTPSEKAILDRLLAGDFAGRDEILQQIAESLVRSIDEDGSLEFRIISPVKATSTKSRVPTEGEAEDVDGITIHFLLHVVNDVVQELEIFKEDNSRPLTMPASNSIRVFAP